jgi:glucosamine-6-phosphate deaminase
MEVIILRDAEQIGAVAADAFETLLTRKPDAVLGLATGSSPLSIYDELVARYEAGRISLGKARGFTLDEYVGLPADHPENYRNFIDRVFVSRVDFPPGAVQGPDGLAADIPAACSAYDRAIRDAGGVDLQILGIGTDGHIGFNEPGSSLASRTRIKTLTRQPASSTATSTQSPPTASPRAWAPSPRPATSSWWPPAGPRPKRSITWRRARSARCGRRASCSTIRT